MKMKSEENLNFKPIENMFSENQIIQNFFKMRCHICSIKSHKHKKILK